MNSEEYVQFASGFLEKGTTKEILYTGLASEAGEVMQLRMLELRKGVYNKEELLLELGDILYYVAMLARAEGSSLSEVMFNNIVKLRKRNVERNTPLQA